MVEIVFVPVCVQAPVDVIVLPAAPNVVLPETVRFVPTVALPEAVNRPVDVNAPETVSLPVIALLPDTVRLVEIVARPVCARSPDVVGLDLVAYVATAFDTCRYCVEGGNASQYAAVPFDLRKYPEDPSELLAFSPVTLVLPVTARLVLIVARPVCARTPDVVGFVAFAFVAI